VVQRQQQSYTSRAWKQLRMLAYYQRYVTAYLKYLQQGKQGSGDPTIDKLDAQLDEAVILLFRRMAHAKLKELRAKASAAEVKQPAQQQTWIGWLMGSGTKPAQQQAQAAEAAGSASGAGELDTSMGVEEWNKLEDVLAQQAVSQAPGPADTAPKPWLAPQPVVSCAFRCSLHYKGAFRLPLWCTITELTADATRRWALLLAPQALSDTPVAQDAMSMIALLTPLHGMLGAAASPAGCTV